MSGAKTGPKKYQFVGKNVRSEADSALKKQKCRSSSFEKKGDREPEPSTSVKKTAAWNLVKKAEENKVNKMLLVGKPKVAKRKIYKPLIETTNAEATAKKNTGFLMSAKLAAERLAAGNAVAPKSLVTKSMKKVTSKTAAPKSRNDHLTNQKNQFFSASPKTSGGVAILSKGLAMKNKNGNFIKKVPTLPNDKYIGVQSKRQKFYLTALPNAGSSLDVLTGRDASKEKFSQDKKGTNRRKNVERKIPIGQNIFDLDPFFHNGQTTLRRSHLQEMGFDIELSPKSKMERKVRKMGSVPQKAKAPVLPSHTENALKEHRRFINERPSSSSSVSSNRSVGPERIELELLKPNRFKSSGYPPTLPTNEDMILFHYALIEYIFKGPRILYAEIPVIWDRFLEENAHLAEKFEKFSKNYSTIFYKEVLPNIYSYDLTDFQKIKLSRSFFLPVKCPNEIVVKVKRPSILKK